MANINQISLKVCGNPDAIANIKDAANTFVKYMNSNNLGPWDNSSVKAICSNINELAFEVRNKNPRLYNDLQDIKSNLFYGQNFINVFYSCTS